MTELYAAHQEWLEDIGHDPFTPEPEVPTEVMAGFAKRARLASGGQSPSTRDAKLWLSQPETYSPFIDEVAVERAVNFDWDVIENLSRVEDAELIKRLAKHHDPLGLLDLARGAVPHMRGDEGDHSRHVPPRRQAFLRGTRARQSNMAQKVYGTRDARRQRAAVAA